MSESSNKPGTGKLVLIVDDDLEIMHMVFSMLEKAGYTVIGTKTAISGIAVARTARPDIILMDVRMPGMDGFEASRKIKADQVTGDIPILVVSASAEHEDPERARDHGADAFLRKPFGPGELIAEIEKLTAAPATAPAAAGAEAGALVQ